MSVWSKTAFQKTYLLRSLEGSFSNRPGPFDVTSNAGRLFRSNSRDKNFPETKNMRVTRKIGSLRPSEGGHISVAW